jgi:hypothetical protein
MTDCSYGIEASWHVEPTSPATLGKKFLNILDTISKVVPRNEQWQLGKPPYREEFVTLGEARAKTADWVNENVAVEDGVADPEVGYMLMALMLAEPSSRMMSLVGRIGGRLGDTIRFRVGDVIGASDPETVTYPLFRTTLLAMISSLPPVWATASFSLRTAESLSSMPEAPQRPKANYSGPWLSFLCAPLAEDLIPPVGVPCERTPDGGLLMIAAEERLDPFNPDHMRRSRAIAEVMIARLGNPPRPGYWPLDKEWPPVPQAGNGRTPPANA